MKIALVEPPSPNTNVYSNWIGKMPLLGLPYLAAILKKEGHDVTIYNGNIALPPEEALKEADCLGISSMTSTAPGGYKLAEKYKEINPNGKVIIGGSHATFMTEEASQYADVVVKGECEKNIADIVENEHSKIVQGESVKYLDDLPFPDLDAIYDFNPPGHLTPIMTSRGCPYNCNFCSVTSMFGRKYRFRSTESVIEELEQYKHRSIFFYDDHFFANMYRAKHLMEEMIRKKITPKWIAQSRLEIAKDNEALELMKKSGCFTLCIGLESTNEETLKKYNKRQSVKQIKESIKKLKKYGIRVHGMFIAEGYEDYNKLNITTLQCNNLTPLPGTPLFEKVKELGKFLINPLKDVSAWAKFDGGHVVHEPDNMSAYEMQRQTSRSYEKFYSLWNCLKQLFPRFNVPNFLLRNIGRKTVKKAFNCDEFQKYLNWLKTLDANYS